MVEGYYRIFQVCVHEEEDGSIVTYVRYVTDKGYPGVQFSNGSYKEYKPAV